MRALGFVAAFVAVALNAAAAAAIDVGVSVRFARVNTDERFDPLAVFDGLGRPDLFFCYRQGDRPWACNPRSVQDRDLQVVAARLPCRNTLTCVFEDLQIRADAPFEFELRDADVSRNEVVESGKCVIEDAELSCDTDVGNAALTLVTDAGAFAAATLDNRRMSAFLELAVAMERDYRAAAPEQSFAFCRDPETAVARYLQAASDLDGVKAMMREPDDGWRVAHRIAEVLALGSANPNVMTSAQALVEVFSDKAVLLDAAIEDIDRRQPGARLAPKAAATTIFRDLCL